MPAALTIEPYLAFDPVDHVYTYGGRRLPSVTQLLAQYGITPSLAGIPADVLEYARDRGTAVHAAIHLEKLGLLDWSTVDPTILPYMDAWNAWRDQCGYVSEGGEVPLVDPVAGYAGMPDDYGRSLRGRYAGFRLVVDRKAVAAVSPSTGVQLAAYRRLLEGVGFRATHRIAVQLFADGTFKEHEFRSVDDWMVFQSILTIEHWVRGSR